MPGRRLHDFDINRIRLDVTQDIIDTSCVADSSHCMIADAVRAALPQATSISVDVQTIRFSVPRYGQRFTYLTPRSAQLALLDFDAGERPDPFSVQLRAPMVTPMRTKPVKPMEEVPQAKLDAIAKAREFIPGGGRKLRGTRPERAATGHTDSPVITSSDVPPPTGALHTGGGRKRRTRDGDVSTARRRTFGLRAMERRS